jgi:hypothetical protein
VVPTRSSSPRSAATSSPDQQTRCHPIHKVRSVRSMNWVRYASPSLAHRRRPGSGQYQGVSSLAETWRSQR